MRLGLPVAVLLSLVVAASCAGCRTPSGREAELRANIGKVACARTGLELGRIVDVDRHSNVTFRHSNVTFAYVVEKDGARRRYPPGRITPVEKSCTEAVAGSQ